MCLFTEQPIQTTPEDITIYKVLEVVPDQKHESIKHLISPFNRGTYWKLEATVNTDICESAEICLVDGPAINAFYNHYGIHIHQEDAPAQLEAKNIKIYGPGFHSFGSHQRAYTHVLEGYIPNKVIVQGVIPAGSSYTFDISEGLVSNAIRLDTIVWPRNFTINLH